MLAVYCRSDDDDDGTEYHCDGSRFVFLFVCFLDFSLHRAYVYMSTVAAYFI